MKTENEIRLMLADYPDSLPNDEELMIAVFMGLQPLIVNEHHKIVGWYRDDPKKWFSFPDYNTWNSLMPVVEKIESMGYWFTINRWSRIYRQVGRLSDGVDETICEYHTPSDKIGNTRKVCIDFIKLQNS